MHIHLQSITKIFGTLRANDDITLELRAGRIIGILGENGAGKSTLMKILAGYQPATSGDILLDGQQVTFAGPRFAIANGIGMLQQDPLDIAAFTVLDNYIYGQQRGALFFNRRRAAADLRNRCEQFNFELNPDALVSDLTIAQRQQLEIVRLLAQGVEVLILDEPTTGISAEQKDLLFDALRNLAANGQTVLLVSHKLEDVIALCNEVVVLRAGKVVAQADMPLAKTEIVAMMFGESRDLDSATAPDYSTSNVIMQVADLQINDGRLHIEGFNLDIRAGEVIGLAGLDGSGQELLMQALCGLHRVAGGRVKLRGNDVTHRPYVAMHSNQVIYGAAGRIEEGLIAGLSLTEHVTLVENERTLIDWREMRKVTQDRIQHYRVRGSANDPIEALSGGNQQRVLMAMMPPAPQLLLLEQPTRGLDVDSAAWIWEQLLARCQRGTALMFSSQELDEILRYSQRIIVFYAGRHHIVDNPAQVTLNELGHMIGGDFHA